MTSPWKRDDKDDAPRDDEPSVDDPMAFNAHEQLRETLHRVLKKPDGTASHGFALVTTDLPDEVGYVTMTNTGSQGHMVMFLYDFLMQPEYRNDLRKVIAIRRLEHLLKGDKDETPSSD